jgi:hypothetical protein
MKAAIISHLCAFSHRHGASDVLATGAAAGVTCPGFKGVAMGVTGVAMSIFVPSRGDQFSCQHTIIYCRGTSATGSANT